MRNCEIVFSDCHGARHSGWHLMFEAFVWFMWFFYYMKSKNKLNHDHKQYTPIGVVHSGVDLSWESEQQRATGQCETFVLMFVSLGVVSWGETAQRYGNGQIYRRCFSITKKTPGKNLFTVLDWWICFSFRSPTSTQGSAIQENLQRLLFSWISIDTQKIIFWKNVSFILFH